MKASHARNICGGWPSLCARMIPNGSKRPAARDQEHPGRTVTRPMLPFGSNRTMPSGHIRPSTWTPRPQHPGRPPAAPWAGFRPQQATWTWTGIRGSCWPKIELRLSIESRQLKCRQGGIITGMRRIERMGLKFQSTGKDGLELLAWKLNQYGPTAARRLAIVTPTLAVRLTVIAVS